MAPPANPRLPRDVRCSKAARRCVRKEVTSETVKVLNTETYDRSMGGGDCLTYHPRGDTPETDGGRHAGRRRPPAARRSCPGIRRAGRWQRQGHGRVRKAAVRGTWSRRRHRACHRPDSPRASERCLSAEPGARATGQAPEAALDQPRGGDRSGPAVLRPRAAGMQVLLTPGATDGPRAPPAPAPRSGEGERAQTCAK